MIKLKTLLSEEEIKIPSAVELLILTWAKVLESDKRMRKPIAVPLPAASNIFILENTLLSELEVMYIPRARDVPLISISLR